MRSIDKLCVLEHTVIATIFKHPNHFIDFIIAGLRADHFEINKKYKEIFEVSNSIFQNGGTPEFNLVQNSVKQKLTEHERRLSDGSEVSPQNIQRLTKEFLCELELVRMSRFGEFLISESKLDSADSESLLARAEQQFLEVKTSFDNTALSSIESIVDDTILTIQKRAMGEEERGVTLGIPSIDKLTIGFQPGSLILFAGRTSHGKSELAIQTVLHNAEILNKRSIIYSLEMSKSQIIERMLTYLSGIEFTSLRNGKINDWDQLRAAQEKLKSFPISIADGMYSSLSDITSSIRKTKLIHPDLSFVVIDYLGLVNAGETESKNQELSLISRTLKALAASTKIVVIGLVQVNRAWSKRDKESRGIELVDLRDSGSLEQDADIVLSVYRYYQDTKNPDDEERALIKILKSRNGPLGQAEVTNRVRTQKFEDYIPF
jgi:replicative DNA helicase